MTHSNGAVTERPVALHQSWTMAGPVISHLPDTQVQELREVSEASAEEVPTAP